MPFKDAAARAEYMRAYLREYRAGKRRGDGAEVVAQRTTRARARTEKQRKALWYLQNKEWVLDRQRERRRSAKAAEAAALLTRVAPPAAKIRLRADDVSASTNPPKNQQAA